MCCRKATTCAKARPDRENDNPVRRIETRCGKIPARDQTSDAKVKPAVVQNRFYNKSGYDREIRAWCAANKVVYQSFWTLTANPHVLKSEAVTSIARDHKKTPAQVFFRFVHQSGMVPLTGTTSAEHMELDLEVPGFELSAEEMAVVEAQLK